MRAHACHRVAFRQAANTALGALARMLALAVAAAAPVASAEPAAARQPWSRPVRFPSGGEEVFFVDLDREVYRVTPQDFADLRLVDDGGQELPYQVQKATEKVWRRGAVTVSGRVASLQELASNRLELVWQPAVNEGPATGLRFETAQRDFERRVSVFDQRGAALVTDALLYDYSRFMDLRALEVRLPTNEATQYRVVIDEITDEAVSPLTEITRSLRGAEEQGRQERFSLERRPMRIDRVSAWRDQQIETEDRDTVRDYGALELAVDDASERGLTVVTVAAGREPLTALHVETDSRNFSRPVEVAVETVSGVQRGWRTVGSGTLSGVQFRAFRQGNLKLGFPEQRAARYRLTIRNGDSPPLHITGVRGEGPIYRLVFLHDGSRPCRLHYGAGDLRPPVYDAAAVLGALRRDARPVQAQLGPPEAGRAARGGIAWRRWLNSRAAFTGVTLLVVAVLGWGLFRAVKSADAGRDAEGGPS